MAVLGLPKIITEKLEKKLLEIVKDKKPLYQIRHKSS